MKISYHGDTDSLYLHLNGVSTAESEEVADGTVIHYGEDGEITGVEFYADASQKVDLSDVEVKGIDSRKASDGRRHGSASAVRRYISKSSARSGSGNGSGFKHVVSRTDVRRQAALDKVAV